VELVEDTITERHLVGTEICDYLLKILVMYLAIFVVYLSKPLFSSFNFVVYLAIFV